MQISLKHPVYVSFSLRKSKRSYYWKIAYLRSVEQKKSSNNSNLYSNVLAGKTCEFEHVFQWFFLWTFKKITKKSALTACFKSSKIYNILKFMFVWFVVSIVFYKVSKTMLSFHRTQIKIIIIKQHSFHK